MGGDNGEKRVKSCQGTFIKDTWTKPKEVGLRVAGRDGRGGENGGGEMETAIPEQQLIFKKFFFISSTLSSTLDIEVAKRKTGQYSVGYIH